ncbi:hypothetical protein JOH51_002534 [Rhizobium leguminosarum]|nr:hypothetical protein [Rhizobium leguminosarum]
MLLILAVILLAAQPTVLALDQTDRSAPDRRRQCSFQPVVRLNRQFRTNDGEIAVYTNASVFLLVLRLSNQGNAESISRPLPCGEIRGHRGKADSMKTYALAAFAAASMAGTSWAATTVKVVAGGEGGGPMTLTLDQPTVKAGETIFAVHNDAMTEEHEMVLVKLKYPDQKIPL